MSRWIRPGPLAIAPGASPGGWVVHVYAVPSNDLLLTRRLAPGADVVGQSFADAAEAERLAPGVDLCLVIFDGDTGERVRP